MTEPLQTGFIPLLPKASNKFKKPRALVHRVTWPSSVDGCRKQGLKNCCLPPVCTKRVHFWQAPCPGCIPLLPRHHRTRTQLHADLRFGQQTRSTSQLPGRTSSSVEGLEDCRPRLQGHFRRRGQGLGYLGLVVITGTRCTTYDRPEFDPDRW